MATMEDLAKISEALTKPKSPKKENTRTFYIIDNNTRYEYKTTALTKTVNSIPKKGSSMLE